MKSQVSRRDFLVATSLAGGALAAGLATAADATTATTGKGKGMKIGFHTDAFNSTYKSFEDCLKWAQKNGVHYIECGLIDGVSWIHGLGYQPGRQRTRKLVVFGRRIVFLVRMTWHAAGTISST